MVKDQGDLSAENRVLLTTIAYLRNCRRMDRAAVLFCFVDNLLSSYGFRLFIIFFLFERPAFPLFRRYRRKKIHYLSVCETQKRNTADSLTHTITKSKIARVVSGGRGPSKSV